MQVLVHGGAGGPPDDRTAARRELEAATDRGTDRQSTRAAVLAAVRHLEAASSFNAGVGSAVQSDGVIRTDAGLMTGAGDRAVALAETAGVDTDRYLWTDATRERCGPSIHRRRRPSASGLDPEAVHATADAAASGTGDGEAIATDGLTRRVVESVGDGESPQPAVDRVVRAFDASRDAVAGLIVVDADGRTGRATNADAMPTAETGRS